MSRNQEPIFVQRQTYRRRRMADAVRLLPILGGILFAMPLLWITEEGAARTTVVMIYLFVVWALLSVLSGLISRRLRSQDETEDQDQEL